MSGITISVNETKHLRCSDYNCAWRFDLKLTHDNNPGRPDILFCPFCGQRTTKLGGEDPPP